MSKLAAVLRVITRTIYNFFLEIVVPLVLLICISEGMKMPSTLSSLFLICGMIAYTEFRQFHRRKPEFRFQIKHVFNYPRILADLFEKEVKSNYNISEESSRVPHSVVVIVDKRVSILPCPSEWDAIELGRALQSYGDGLSNLELVKTADAPAVLAKIDALATQ